MMRPGFPRCRPFVASLLVVLLADSAILPRPAVAGPSPAPAPSAPTTPTAAGPATLSDSLSGQAKDDYESGRILFENGDNAGALVKFQHAFDLSSDSRLLWDMGACEKNLRHYVHVLRLVERY